MAAFPTVFIFACTHTTTPTNREVAANTPLKCSGLFSVPQITSEKKLAFLGKSVPFTQSGKKFLYRKSDLQKYFDEHPSKFADFPL
jgi:hypothetical protein